ADGGIYTAKHAKDLGLIDQIGTLEQAAAEAARQANVTEYKVVQYERPKTFADALFGASARGTPQQATLLDAQRWGNAAVPRVWYLAPGCELAGMLAAVAAE